MSNNSEKFIEDGAPKMADFGLDESIYQKIKNKKQELNNIRDEYLVKIRSVQGSFIIGLMEFLIWCFFIILPFSFGFFVGGETDSFIYAFLAFGLVVFLNFKLILKISDENNLEGFKSLITLGRYNKFLKGKQDADDGIKKLEELTEKKIGPFENALYGYYKDKIDKFYSSKLYNKRSGSPDFENSLIEFDSMIKSLSQLRKVFLTKSLDFNLREYKDYVGKRMSDHFAQREKVEVQEFNPIKEFIKKATSATSEKIKSPEEKYRTPRKIDWDVLNKDRAKTGLKGEELVVEIEKEYFVSIGKDDLAEKVRHISVEDGDGSGYDILSFFEDGREKYIEVKSTTKSLEAPFYISSNELEFLRQHQEDAFIYRMQIAHDSNEYYLEVKSGADVLASGEIIPTQYVVKAR